MSFGQPPAAGAGTENQDTDNRGTGDAYRTLTDLAAALGRVTESADHDFVAIGHVLTGAVSVFGRLSGEFARLAEHLHGEDAGAATAALESAMGRTSLLSAAENRSAPLLQRLDQLGREAGTRVGSLRKIIGEIGALAINGKIQAAQVAARDVDFSVFTTEIGRLGRLAEASTEQAASRLQTVAAAVAAARQAATDFERNEARELDDVRRRITESLAVLAQRRRMAAGAAESVSARSRQISERISRTVAELQINDSVCQRVEHVRTALGVAAMLASGRPPAEAGISWPGGDALPLAAGICHLQVEQLRGGADDYHREVRSLAANLAALADDAAAIRSEADSAFSGAEGGLFVSDMARDIRRAAELLAAYTQSRQHTQEVVGTVGDAFRAMAEDLRAIRSVDADMRIMGLNATLKCGRLGDDGRALGVVAHELRACSRRTEDCTHGIAEVLAQVMEVSDALAAASRAERAVEADIPLDVMDGSVEALNALAGTLAAALEQLRAESAEMSHGLTAAAQGIDIHQRVKAAAGQAIERLAPLADRLHPRADLGDDAQDALLHLMRPHYTMASERLIHRTFHGGDTSDLLPEPAEADESAGDIDGLFF